MASEPARRYRIGTLTVDLDEGRVQRPDGRVNLSPRLLRLLEVLLEAAPRLVRKEQLMDAVWADRVVAAGALTQRIKELRKLLGDDARNPCYIQTVPKRGYRLVAPVEPLRGAQAALGTGGESGEEAVELGDKVAVVAPVPSRMRVARRTILALLLAGVLVLAALAARRALLAGGGSGGEAVPAPLRRAVAVLPLRQLPGREGSDWIGVTVAELLRHELTAGEWLRVLPADQVERALADLERSAGQPAETERFAALRRTLGADLVVTGTYLAAGSAAAPQLRLDLTVQGTPDWEAVAVISRTGGEDQLLELVARSGEQLRHALGVGPLSAEDLRGLRAALPANLVAARCLSEGLARMRQFDFTAAQELLEQAVAADPSAPLAHAALADAWSWLGYESRAREASRRAFELSGNLSRAQQLEVEQGFRERSQEWPRAVEIARALYAFFPDNLDSGLSLVSALSWAGEEDAAAATLAQLRRLPPPAGADPRIDLAEAWLADDDLERKLAAANRAAAKAEAQGATFLLAAARVQQGWAWGGMGEPARALWALEEARRIRTAAGDRVGVCKVLLHIGQILHRQGDLLGAQNRFEEAVGLAREVGSLGFAADGLHRSALVLLDRDELAAARSRLEQALALGEELEQKAGVAAMRVSAAAVTLAEGRAAEAEAAVRALLGEGGLAGRGELQARAQLVLARALLRRERGNEAVLAAQRAAKLAARTGSQPVALEAAVVAARAQGRVGRVAEALRTLSEVAERAAAAGLIGVQLEARLARAEIELRSSGRHRAAADLTALGAEAEGKGFALLAREAARLARGALPSVGRAQTGPLEARG